MTTAILTVTSDYTTLPLYFGTPSDYTGMNIDDGDTSYSYQHTSYYPNQLWNFSTMPASTAIASLTIYCKAKYITEAPSYQANISGLVRDFSTSLTSDYTLLSCTLTTNPSTALPWTTAGINGHTYGVILVGGPISVIRTSYIYLSVDYTPVPKPRSYGVIIA